MKYASVWLAMIFCCTAALRDMASGCLEVSFCRALLYSRGSKSSTLENFGWLCMPHTWLQTWRPGIRKGPQTLHADW